VKNKTPLGDAIAFAATPRGKAEAIRWLARNNPNIAVPLSEAIVGPTLTADELATGLRTEGQLGHPLYVSPHVGADFVDTAGATYDALLQPGASGHWATEWPNIQQQLLRHLGKANFTIVDATGLLAAQIADLTAYVNGLTAAQQAKIIRIGF
jgi:CdiA C-terminal tRNase domain